MILNDMGECVIMAMWKKERLKKDAGCVLFYFRQGAGEINNNGGGKYNTAI